MSDFEVAPAKCEDTLQDNEEFPGGHSQPFGTKVFVKATGTLVEEEHDDEEQVDGGKPLRTSSTSKVGVEHQPITIVNEVKPFLWQIQHKIDGSQDLCRL